jgi:hypothetical protein
MRRYPGASSSTVIASAYSKRDLEEDPSAASEESGDDWYAGDILFS